MSWKLSKYLFSCHRRFSTNLQASGGDFILERQPSAHIVSQKVKTIPTPTRSSWTIVKIWKWSTLVVQCAPRIVPHFHSSAALFLTKVSYQLRFAAKAHAVKLSGLCCCCCSSKGLGNWISTKVSYCVWWRSKLYLLSDRSFICYSGVHSL